MGIKVGYPFEDFADHTAPSAGPRVRVPAALVGLDPERVVETAHEAQLVDQIDAVALEPIVALQLVARLLQHSVRRRLKWKKKSIL